MCCSHFLIRFLQHSSTFDSYANCHADMEDCIVSQHTNKSVVDRILPWWHSRWQSGRLRTCPPGANEWFFLISDFSCIFTTWLRPVLKCKTWLHDAGLPRRWPTNRWKTRGTALRFTLNLLTSRDFSIDTSLSNVSILFLIAGGISRRQRFLLPQRSTRSTLPSLATRSNGLRSLSRELQRTLAANLCSKSSVIGGGAWPLVFLVLDALRWCPPYFRLCFHLMTNKQLSTFFNPPAAAY